MSDGEQSAAFQSHCHSCGVPWASHMGIVGTCAEKAQLRKERDEARRIACELKTTNQQGRYSFAIIMGWDCYKETT